MDKGCEKDVKAASGFSPGCGHGGGGWGAKAGRFTHEGLERVQKVAGACINTEGLYTGIGAVEGPNQARIQAISTVTHPLLRHTAISRSIKK